MIQLAALAGETVYSDLTPREMFWISEAKDKQQWNHTAAVLCMINNTNLSKNEKRKKPDDFNPYTETLFDRMVKAKRRRKERENGKRKKS